MNKNNFMYLEGPGMNDDKLAHDAYEQGYKLAYDTGIYSPGSYTLNNHPVFHRGYQQGVNDFYDEFSSFNDAPYIGVSPLEKRRVANRLNLDESLHVKITRSNGSLEGLWGLALIFISFAVIAAVIIASLMWMP